MSDSRRTLDELLAHLQVEKNLCAVIKACALSTEQIARALRDGVSTEELDTKNAFGDQQLEVDVFSDKCVFKNLRECKVCAVAASEETPEEVVTAESVDGTAYCVGFDPLDGSSIVDCNFAVGSIFGIWEGSCLRAKSGNDMRAAIMAMYGPRLSMALAVKGVAVELQCLHGVWRQTRDNLTIAADGKIFGPGNLRASREHSGYEAMMSQWLEQKYTLRYTGGMVPDVYHILLKQKGIFVNAPSTSAPAKLRLIYECAPIAYIVEAAKGQALVVTTEGLAGRILDIKIDNLDQRLGVCYGGTKEVEKLQKHFGIAPTPGQSQESA